MNIPGFGFLRYGFSVGSLQLAIHRPVEPRLSERKRNSIYFTGQNIVIHAQKVNYGFTAHPRLLLRRIYSGRLVNELFFRLKEITAQQIKSHKKRNGKKKFLQCLQYDGATLIN